MMGVARAMNLSPPHARRCIPEASRRPRGEPAQCKVTATHGLASELISSG